MSSDKPISAVDPDRAPVSETVAGLARQVVFDVDGYRLERAFVDDETGWVREESPRYGWVREGSCQLQYGTGHADLSPGTFVRIPAGVAHRYRSEGVDLLSVVRGESSPVAVDPATSEADVRPTAVGPDDLEPGVESPDIVRETPFPEDGNVFVLRASADAGAKVGWHHHGENVYFGYFVGPQESASAIEYGPDGSEVATVDPGECFHVPPGLVHRDTNPSEQTHTAVIWLCGGSPWVVNVDGPA